MPRALGKVLQIPRQLAAALAVDRKVSRALAGGVFSAAGLLFAALAAFTRLRVVASRTPLAALLAQILQFARERAHLAQRALQALVAGLANVCLRGFDTFTHPGNAFVDFSLVIQRRFALIYQQHLPRAANAVVQAMFAGGTDRLFQRLVRFRLLLTGTVGQLAQFGTVTGIAELNTSVNDLASSLISSQSLGATNFIGKNALVAFHNGS